MYQHQSGKASSTANDPFSNLRGPTQPIANQGTSMSQNSSFYCFDISYTQKVKIK